MSSYKIVHRLERFLTFTETFIIFRLDMRRTIEDKVRFLRERGVVMTIQRIAVLEALDKIGKAHPAAEDLYNHLRERYPTLSLATVYNTLDVFHRFGLVQELSFPRQERRYDTNTKPHPHFFCRVCGRVWDVTEICPIPGCPVLKMRTLDGNRVERVQICFYGVCEECLSREANETKEETWERRAER